MINGQSCMRNLDHDHSKDDPLEFLRAIARGEFGASFVVTGVVAKALVEAFEKRERIVTLLIDGAAR